MTKVDLLTMKIVSTFESNQYVSPGFSSHIALSPSKNFGALGSRNGSIIMINTNTNKEEEVLTDEHMKSPVICTWSSYENRFASADKAGNLFTWK